MIRTIINPNGNIEYLPNISNQSLVLNRMPFLTPIIDPYSNSSIIITPDPESETDSYTIFPRSIYQPSLYNPRSILDVNNDPELRRRITKYFYEKYKNIWLPFSFIKLQKYLKNEEGKINFIKNINEYDAKIVNDDLKIDFILDNILGKHELLKFLDKFVRTYNVNWYDLKKYTDKIKYELYDKIKNHMKKIVIRKL